MIPFIALGIAVGMWMFYLASDQDIDDATTEALMEEARQAADAQRRRVRVKFQVNRDVFSEAVAERQRRMRINSWQ